MPLLRRKSPETAARFKSSDADPYSLAASVPGGAYHLAISLSTEQTDPVRTQSANLSYKGRRWHSADSGWNGFSLALQPLCGKETDVHPLQTGTAAHRAMEKQRVQQVG